MVSVVVNPAEHRGLVWRAARYWAKRRGGSVEDLAQQGFLGLMEAAKRYDPRRGKFATYAYWWINAKIQHWVRDKVNVIRNPRLDRLKSPAIIPNVVSIDRTVTPDGRSLHEVLTDGGARTAEDVLGLKEECTALLEEFDRLPSRLQTVLEGRFAEDKTYRAIGAELGLSHERVRQLEREALETLRARLAGRLGR